jgi:hypothetical protein
MSNRHHVKEGITPLDGARAMVIISTASPRVRKLNHDGQGDR